MSSSGEEDIAVIISAQIGELQRGLKEATDSIKEFSSNIKEGMEKGGEASEHFSEKLGLALEGGIFLEFEEIAKQALEVVEEAFEKTAKKAEEFGLANSKFAAIMGSSTESASGLDAALKSVGVSLTEYESVALRMEMRLKTQEQAFNTLGMATRDHNGDLLQGEALMNSAIATMQQYKTGTDQNEFALQVFGRRAQQIYDIMRVGLVEQQDYKDDMAALGVNMEDTGEKSVELEASQGRLKQLWEDLEIAIGQKLMPVFTEFFKWLHDYGVPVLQVVGVALLGVVTAIDVLVTAVSEIWTLVVAAFTQMADIVIGFTKVWAAVLLGDFKSAGESFKETIQTMKTDFIKSFDEMQRKAEDFGKREGALWGGSKESGENPFAKGGDKKYVDPTAGKEAQQLLDEQIRGAEALALARIKSEEQADQAILALSKETVTESYVNQVDFENRRYAVQRDALDKKAQVDTADKVKHQKDLDDLAVLEVTHSNTLDKLYENLLEKKQQLAHQELQAELQDDNSRLTNAIAAINEEYKQHLLSADEKATAERNLTTTIYGQELARLDAEMATLTKGTKAWEDAYKQRAKIAQEMAKAVEKIDNDQKNFSQQRWDQLANSIRSSFNGALNGMLLGTTSWQAALGQVINSIANAFLDMGEKILEDWITTQIAKEAISKTTETTSAVSQIAAAAAIASANTFAAISAIPIVGPELAPAAAAASYAQVISMEGLAFAEQGMLLDRDRLVYAHKDEQILPPHLSKGIQNLISGGGNNNGGDSSLHYSPTINAPGNKTLAQLLFEESHTMRAWLTAQKRAGAFG